MSAFIRKYYVIISLMLVFFAVNFDKNLIGMAIIPIREQFGLSATQAGMMMSAYSLGYALVSFPGGLISDKFGYKRVLLACLSLATISAFIFPFASILALFITVRFLLGFAHGSVPSATTKGIALNYDKERRIMIQSVWFVAQNIAGFAATYIGARIIAINYQYAYWVASALYVLIFILVLKYLPNMKASLERSKTSDQPKKKIHEVFKDRNMWIFAICIFMFNLILNGSNNWYATFLSTTFQQDMVVIGNILAISSLVAIGCSPLTGFMLAKVFKGRENWFIFISTALTAIAFYIMVTSGQLAIAVGCIYFTAYTSMFPFVAIKTLPQKLTSEEYIGTTMGIITAVSSFGGFVAPTLVGAMLDAGGGKFEQAYLLLAALGIIAGIVALFGLKLPKTRETDQTAV